MRDLMEEIELADDVGLDVFGIGEHHREDFAVSAPTVVLGAAAVRTKRIRLTSAVSVLSSDDPIRVFQQFATVDLLSGGRAEIMAGRGSFIESFPLFGYDLADYDRLFEEKLEQLLAIIGGRPEQFVPFVELYRQSAAEAGHDPAQLPVSINSHAYVADTPEEAVEEYFPAYTAMMNAIGRERGWTPIQRPDFDALRSPRGALVVGSPQEVIEKILFQHEIFGHQRFLAQMSVGTMPHRNVLRAIELLGTEVAPAVRKATA
jgi:alkanesulfonate monooxygenase SsuD/methylene tetrahydromethanopterin reductase-like flavin-dependent oxidoreductase (luciferase family)